SLALVVFSTLLSPLTTPFVLMAYGSMASGDYAQILQNLSGSQTGAFLMLCVVLPSLSGLIARRVIGEGRVARAKPWLTLASSVILLFLCYANAAAALPHVVSEPDWDFLAIVLAISTFVCTATFIAGWALSRMLKVDRAQERSLMFGLGMNN